MEGWKSRWYASKQEFRDLILEDFKVREFIKKKYQVRRHSRRSKSNAPAMK